MGLASRKSIATPATWGVAIEVPLMVIVAVLDPIQPAVIPTPGAKMSTQVPKFEKLARASVLVLAATVRAEVTRAGDVLHALPALLPAAMAYTTPKRRRQRPPDPAPKKYLPRGSCWPPQDAVRSG